MPVFNAERYIGDAVHSVLGQTWIDWELVVIDDGSTDSTPMILAGFADSRVRVVRQENRGEAGARNTGLMVAKGEYVAFLDADDLYLSSALFDLVEYLDSHPDVHVLFADGYFCDENCHPMMRLSEHRPGPYTGMILEPLVLSPSVISVPSATAFRRASAEALDLHFDEQLQYGVDWDFWIHMARFYRFGYLAKLTCLYRVHDTNMTAAVTLQKRKRQLLAGRRKILESGWFDQLSAPTRRAFLNYVLLDLLAEDPAMQQEILDTPQFQALSSIDRANLHRTIATSELLRNGDIVRVRSQLQLAVAAWPEDRKSKGLLSLSNVSAASCRAAVRGWSALHSGATQLRPYNQHQPKPVPAALLPKP